MRRFPSAPATVLLTFTAALTAAACATPAAAPQAPTAARSLSAAPLSAPLPPPPSANLQRLTMARIDALRQELASARDESQRGGKSLLEVVFVQRKLAAAAREPRLPREVLIGLLRAYRDAMTEASGQEKTRFEKGAAGPTERASVQASQAEAELWLAEATEARGDPAGP